MSREPPIAPGSRTGANFLFNVGGSLATLLISLVTIPIYVREMGDARYGVLSVAWLLLGYLGFLDLGLARASANGLARLGEGRGAERAEILATAFALNLGFGLVGSLVLLVAGEALFGVALAIPAAIRPEIAGAVPWLAALLPLALMSGVAIGALESRDRFGAANGLQVLGAALGQVVPAGCALLVSPRLDLVLPVAVVARAATLALTIVVVLRGEEPVRPRHVDRARARALFGYGGWVSVSAMASPILTSIDQVLIGRLLGVAAVTYYAVPMGVVLRSQIFALALSRALFPALSRAGRAEARRLGHGALVTLGLGYAAVCGPAILLARPAFELWLGADFAATAAPVARLLLLGAWVNGMAFLPFGLLQAQGRPDIVAKFHLAETLPFLAVLWVATERFGLAGAAGAWSLRVAGDAALLLWASGFPSAAAARLVAPAAALAGAFWLAQADPMGTAATLAVAVALGVGLVALALVSDGAARDLARLALARGRRALS